MSKRSVFRRSIAFLALSACLASVHATELGDHFSLSGFGTIAALKTDTDDARYVRESQTKGASDSPSFGTDSDFGLQLNAKANDWLSATVQTVTKRRAKTYNATQVEWAFVKVEPVAGLSFRAGRMAMPTFAFSDSRNIGYSNPWLHAPNEVYGIAMVDRLDGADLTYAFGVAGGSLKTTVLAGRSEYSTDLDVFVPDLVETMDVNHVRGVNLAWENDWLSLRAGRIQVRAGLPSVAGGGEAKNTFDGVGATINHNNFLFQTEYVRRRGERKVSRQSDTDAWYVLGGYRIGQFQPFVGYAKLDPTRDADVVNGRQTTTSLGVRWDFHRSMALKAQWDIVDTHGTNGVSFHKVEPSFDGKANVAALAFDFVF